MAFLIRVFCSCALLFCLSGCSGGSAPAGATDTGAMPPLPPCSIEQRKAELDTALAAVSTDTDFSFAVERSDGLRYNYNRGASTMSTMYESASTSKLVTAVVILRLVEQGYLKLKEHPQDYIADWPISSSDPLYAMTLAQLLSFTSGLTSEPFCQNLPWADFSVCVNTIAASNANNGITPGTQFYYASTHLQVAGLMALHARGLPTWQDLFDEFRSQTGLFPTSGYDLPSSGNPRLAGGMHWNGTEYLAFLKALKEGRLLNSRLMAELLKDRTGDGVTIVYSPVSDIGEEWHYGFGFWHECRSPDFNCTPAERISSPGAYGAYPFWDRTKNYIGIVARQGELQTGFLGVTVERAVRPQLEAWAACR